MEELKLKYQEVTNVLTEMDKEGLLGKNGKVMYGNSFTIFVKRLGLNPNNPEHIDHLINSFERFLRR